MESALAARKSRTSAWKASVSSSNCRSNSGQLSQLWFDHLAARIARQLVDEPHRPRRLEVRHMLSGVSDHGLFVEGGTGPGHDEGTADLAEALVGNPDHRR